MCVSVLRMDSINPPWPAPGDDSINPPWHDWSPGIGADRWHMWQYSCYCCRISNVFAAKFDTKNIKTWMNCTSNNVINSHLEM